MRKWKRKLLVFFLAVSMAVTAVIPTRSMAAEEGKSVYVDGTEQTASAENGIPAEVSTEEQLLIEKEQGDESTQIEESVQTPEKEMVFEETPEGEAIPEGVQMPEEEREPEGIQIPEGETASEETQMPDEERIDEETQIFEEEPTEDTQATEDIQVNKDTETEDIMQLQSEEEGLMPLAGTFDINQPVIEDFTFEENGQELTADDTLHFTISAYDADSGIQAVYINVCADEAYGTGAGVSCTKDEGSNLYTGELLCKELVGINFYISSVTVKDMVGNYTDWKVTDDNYQCIYKFMLVNDDNGDISVSNIQMQINDINEDGKLSVGDTVTYTADIICNNEQVNRAEMIIGNDNNCSEWLTAEYDLATKKITSTYTITDGTYPGTWKLGQIDVWTESGKRYSFDPNQIDPNAELKFIVSQEGYDTEKPVIESITLDKNGQMVEAGNVVTITVKASDEHLSSTAWANFSPIVSNVDISNGVTLTLNADTGEYIGTIAITDDTYPCEWDLTDLQVWDEAGNTTYLHDFREDCYTTYPWYYKVKAGDTYVENVKDISFEFYGLKKEQGSTHYYNTQIANQTVKYVGRRASLEDLGVALPQLEAIEGVKFVGWKYNGVVVDKNTQLVFNNTSDYNQTCILEACYDGYPITATARYSNQDGNVITASLSKTYPAGTKVRDLLADLDNLDKPADVKGAKFEKWIMPYSWVDEDDEISLNMMHFDAVAVYNGKTTVDATYIYRCEDGNMAYDNKMILVDGENLSDAAIRAEAGKGVNNIKHFEGLKLSEWTNDIIWGEGQARYREGQFVAEYSNCLVELVYPDGNEYFVVDRGEQFTLPTDHDEYKNIVWYGYQQGATVTVTGDMDFYVTSFELKDEPGNPDKPNDTENPDKPDDEGNDIGTVDGTGNANDIGASNDAGNTGATGNADGVRLSEAAIAGITAEIANTANGGAVTVDMKNATVVPKQILESARGKAVDIILHMNGYQWVINGMDIAATDLKDINLEVKLDTDATPTSLIKSIAGDNPTRQLSLTHNGDFGFRARLILNLGSEHSGEFGNLYYYDSTGKLVFMNAGQIGADGTTALTFSHASDYVIVIGGKAVAEPAEAQGGSGGRKSPKTGE